MSKTIPDKKTFEYSLGELEGIVKKLETGQLSLEDSLELFERGVEFYRECKKELNKADKKMAKLTDLLKEENLSD